jgi:tetratricopeptide (TPR) repeat protein
MPALARTLVIALPLVAACGGPPPASPDPAPAVTEPRSDAPLPPSDAGPAAEARRHYEHGVRLRQQGNVEQAIEEFRASDALVPTPRAALAIARCLDNLGQQVAAVAAYEVARDRLEAGNPMREEIEKHIANLKRGARTALERRGAGRRLREELGRGRAHRRAEGRAERLRRLGPRA